MLNNFSYKITVEELNAVKALMQIGVYTTRIPNIFPNVNSIIFLRSLWEECHDEKPKSGGRVFRLETHYGRHNDALIELALFSEIYIKMIGGDSVITVPNARLYKQSMLDGTFVKAWKLFESSFKPKRLIANDAILCAKDLCTQDAVLKYCANCNRRYLHIYSLSERVKEMPIKSQKNDEKVKQYQKCPYCLRRKRYIKHSKEIISKLSRQTLP